MQIELTGCTGAGKSTLASAMIKVAQERGSDVLMADAFVMKHYRLNWVKSLLARTLLVDLLALPACVISWRRNRNFYAFARRIIFRLPIGGFEKLNLMRNVLKKIGIYEIIQRHNTQSQMVLVDEGTLHAAHNLFVHMSVAPNEADIAPFARLVPLPDVALYVSQCEEQLVQRTHARGHKRIPDCSPVNAQLFIERAMQTFDRLRAEPLVERKLWRIDDQQNLIVDPQAASDARLMSVKRIIRAGLQAVTAQHALSPELQHTAMVSE